MFPSERFSRAGASPQEIAALQAEFDALPAAAQASRLSELAAVAQADLADILHARRSTVPEQEPDVLLGVLSPPEPQAEPSTDTEPEPSAEG